jgi:hypothetical protein
MLRRLREWIRWIWEASDIALSPNLERDDERKELRRKDRSGAEPPL